MGVGAGVTLADGTTLAAATGDAAAVTGVMPATGDTPGTAGLANAGAVGTAAAGLAGVVPGGGGGGWPTEVKTRVTEQRLAISSVFIRLIGKFFPARIPISIYVFVYPQSDWGESSKTFTFVFSTFRILAKPLSLFRIIRRFGL
jgi:hypothetical protein